MSELYEHDRNAFRRYLHWLRDLDLAFVPEHSTKLKLATLLLGYENALRVAATYRRLRAGTFLPMAMLVAGQTIEAGLRI